MGSANISPRVSMHRNYARDSNGTDFWAMRLKCYAMKFDKIRPMDDKLVNVIIETPAGSQNKFNYDPKLRIFKLKKALPMGTVFPFDFGFVPNTQAPDGDPLDVLVLMDQHAFSGCLVQCRLL